MKITREMIESARTPAGGWTRQQLAAWGVKWPPCKGWKKRLQAGKDPNGHWMSIQERDRLSKQYAAMFRNQKMDREFSERLEREL